MSGDKPDKTARDSTIQNQGQADGLTSLEIAQRCASGIEEEALHATRIFMALLESNDLPGGNGRELILRGPGLGLVLQADVILPGLESFEGDTGIAVIAIADFQKIVEASIDRQ